jgi:hypothetical protein
MRDAILAALQDVERETLERVAKMCDGRADELEALGNMSVGADDVRLAIIVNLGIIQGRIRALAAPLAVPGGVPPDEPLAVAEDAARVHCGDAGTIRVWSVPCPHCHARKGQPCHQHPLVCMVRVRAAAKAQTPTAPESSGSIAAAAPAEAATPVPLGGEVAGQPTGCADCGHSADEHGARGYGARRSSPSRKATADDQALRRHRPYGRRPLMFMREETMNAWYRRKRCRLCGAAPGEMCSYPNGRSVPRGHGIRQLEASIEPRPGDLGRAAYEATIEKMWRGRWRGR